jgi:hypothetical protein
MGRASDLRRIQALSPLHDGEQILATTRVWASSPTRLGPLTTSRVRATVSLTDRRLLVHPVGFWSRRPHEVGIDRTLDTIVATPLTATTGHRVQVVLADGRSAVLHFGSSDDARTIVDQLLGRDGERKGER